MPLKSLLRALALVLAAAPLPLVACEGRLHIELEHAGVYALDHASIVAAQPGLADCAVDELVLTHNGKEVPLRVVAEGGRFAKGDRIEWVGQPLHGPESWYDAFSVNNVYLLGAAPGTHARLRDVVASGSGRAGLQRELHIEHENLMIRLDQTQQKPGEESDVWQWAKLTQVDPKPFETEFDLPDLRKANQGDTPLQLTLNFRGLSELRVPSTHKDDARPSDHTVEVSINGHALAPLQWNGRDEVRRELQVPLSALKAQRNTLTLTVPKRSVPWDAAGTLVDVVMFNWLEARYPIGGHLDASTLPLSVSTPTAEPLQLTSRGASAPVLYGSDGVRRPGHALGRDQYAFAASDPDVKLLPVRNDEFARPIALRAVHGEEWQHPDQGYDYLIVAHAHLIDAIRPLAEFHRKRGLSVAILDVESVYDQFNHGIMHPQAIRNLVSTAYNDWPTKPRFLLLVGDASFDIRHETYNDLNYAKWTNQELLFPGHFGSVPSSQYAQKPKKLADRNLIPTWQYPSEEGQSASDNWFGAVDGDDWHPVVAVGRFPVVEPAEVTAIVDKTIDYLTTPQFGAWRRDVMFITDEIDFFKKASDEIASELGKDGFLADKVYADPKKSNNAAHQRAIQDGIDDGRLLVHFLGHGGRYIWRTGPPDLQKNNDLFTLDDVGKLKNDQRLPMVLSMTCYSAPFDNPTEDSIGEKFLREGGKGAIAVFAASWRNSPSPAFSKAIISELLTPGATIGEAIVRAKKTSKNRTLVEMYNLLGDPAVVLERPRDQARVALDGNRWNPGVLVDLRQPRFDGKVTVDWLDAKGKKLKSSTFKSTTPRFRLAAPAVEDKVGEVRVYAVSSITGRDSVGGVDVPQTEPQGTKSLRVVFADWWREFTRPPYKPPVRHADTISIMDFDDPQPAQTAAAQQASAAAASSGTH